MCPDGARPPAATDELLEVGGEEDDADTVEVVVEEVGEESRATMDYHHHQQQQQQQQHGHLENEGVRGRGETEGAEVLDLTRSGRQLDRSQEGAGTEEDDSCDECDVWDDDGGVVGPSGHVRMLGFAPASNAELLSVREWEKDIVAGEGGLTLRDALQVLEGSWRVRMERRQQQEVAWRQAWVVAEQQVEVRMREEEVGGEVLALLSGSKEEQAQAKRTMWERRLGAVRALQQEMLEAQHAQRALQAQQALWGGQQQQQQQQQQQLWGGGVPSSLSVLGRVERLRAQQARGADITAAIAASVKQVLSRLYACMRFCFQRVCFP